MDRLRLFIEAFGVLAIVLSLVFVGFQLELEQTFAKGAQYQGRAEITSGNIQAMMQSETALSRIAKSRGYVEEDGYTPEEQAVKYLGIWMGFIAWDNVEYQYQLGLLDEDWWLGAREGLKRELRDTDRRKYFEEAAERDSFSKLIQELGDEIDRE
jgi:hypothetical protein